MSILDGIYLVEEVTHSSTPLLIITSSTYTTFVGSSISPYFTSLLMDVSQNIQFDNDPLGVLSIKISPHLTASPITSPILFPNTSFTIPLSASTSTSQHIIPIEIIASSGEIQTSALTIFTIPTPMTGSSTTLVPKKTLQASHLV